MYNFARRQISYCFKSYIVHPWILKVDFTIIWNGGVEKWPMGYDWLSILSYFQRSVLSNMLTKFVYVSWTFLMIFTLVSLILLFLSLIFLLSQVHNTLEDKNKVYFSDKCCIIKTKVKYICNISYLHTMCKMLTYLSTVCVMCLRFTMVICRSMWVVGYVWS